MDSKKIKRAIAKTILKSWEIKIRMPVFFIIVIFITIPSAYADAVLVGGLSLGKYIIICMVESFMIYLGYLIGINHPKLDKFEELLKNGEENTTNA